MHLFLLLTTALWATEPPSGGWAAPPKHAKVLSVYDGDTVTLEGNERVRLRWVNTPELKPPEPYGAEAGAFARSFVNQKEVTLEVGLTPRDGYGRILAGLSTSQGDLSLKLLEQGLAHLFIIPPDQTDLSALINAQVKAQEAHLGIWSTKRYHGALHITSFHANAPGDDRENINGEYLRVANVHRAPVNLQDYTLKDANGATFKLANLVIPVGHTVVIHSGKGVSQTNPLKQLTVYLQSNTPVWNNSGDRATLLDSAGHVVDARQHAPKSSH